MRKGAKIGAAPNNKGSVINIIASLTLSVSSIVGSSHLLLSHSITELSFIALCGLSVLIGFLILWKDRILSVSFKDLSVQLAKIEETRIEVEAKREEIERMAVSIADMMGFLAAFHRRLGSEKSHKLEAEWLEANIDLLLRDSQVGSDVREKAFRWLRAVRYMDGMERGEKSNDEWNRVWSMVEEEIKEANKTSHATATSRPVGGVF
jgi:hypothetical protein